MKYSEVTKLIKSFDEKYFTKIDSKYFYVRYKTSAITFSEVAQVDIEHPYILNTRIKFTEFPRYEEVWKALSLLASTDIKDRLDDHFYNVIASYTTRDLDSCIAWGHRDTDNINEKFYVEEINMEDLALSDYLFTKELYEQLIEVSQGSYLSVTKANVIRRDNND
ncbi:hypothetical protein HWC08_gp029 [Lactobacillus phage 521B]|uniref:Uncharacterized protein n=1 Tax=Lactobacillus phage 521B TaxID=2510942 RepID=A0A4Y5FEA8_9CAUD|nr:hypothetical protein HWC08_gp029 [Lactobacillus phage 521B]QBJ03379.1 hypothetical protein B521_0029 [Lactobacillus phage 521B]